MSQAMATPTVLYVGVDVAKAELVSALYVPGRDTRLPTVSNDATGFEALATHVEAARGTATVRLIVEPTGGYEGGLLVWAHARGWQVVLVNARQVRDWAKGQGQRAKTDALDARLLAHYAAERPENRPLPLWQPLPEALTRLDTLVARRRELEQMAQMERNRQAMYATRPGMDAHVGESVAAVLAALSAALEEVNRAIEELIDQRPDIQAQLDQLDSLPGVGP